MHKKSKFPIFWQAESTDCGPACIQMLCHYYGKRHSQRYIKDGINLSRIGVTIGDVVRRCKDLGFDSTAVSCTVDQLIKLDRPIILHWKNSHFVVLYSVKKKYSNNPIFLIADPANGRITFSLSEFSKNFITHQDSGIGILAIPNNSFYEKNVEKDNSDQLIAKDIISKLQNHKKKLIVGILCTSVSIGCSWILPYIYQQMIDLGVIERNTSAIIYYLSIQICFFIGFIVSNLCGSYLFCFINFALSIDYVRTLLFKIMRLPQQYFDTHLNSEFLQRLEDFNRIRTFLTDQVISITFSILNLIVFGGILCYFSILAFLIFFIFSVCVFLFNSHFLNKRKFIDYTLFSEQAHNKNILNEIIMGMGDIRANNAQKSELDIWETNQSHINALYLEQIKLNYKQNVGQLSINRMRDLIIIGICCILSVSSNFSIGTILSVSYILGQLSNPMSQLQNFSIQLQTARISLNRLAEVQRKNDEQVFSEAIDTPKASYIKFTNVSFKYPGSFAPWIFQNLNLLIPQNKVTAIVGNSGSGKTTILKLILGFYKPTDGIIHIGDMPLESINIYSWRNLFGTVLQDGQIFSGSISDNICLTDKNINLSKLHNAADIACIKDFIESQPGRYSMKIGGTGLNLSAGQKQRILIARAIYRNPEILIFDEATSSLDTVNERKIMDNLKSIFQGKTVIIIAHRLSTVVNADNIIYLDHGAVAEQGTHTELVEKKGKYFELIRNQLEIES